MNTGNQVVDKIGEMNISGNIIPQSWYSTITRDTGKPYLTAIVILSDIVYWYRPTEVRDEGTGQIVSYKKKFSSDKLQRSYQQIADMFGVSKKDATNAVVYLEKLGVIKREFRKISINGVVANNVLFIGLNPERLMEITYPKDGIEVTPTKETPITQNGDRGVQSGGEVTAKSEGTYTETIPKIIPKTSQEDNKGKTRKQFVPPTLEEVRAYCAERKNNVDAQKFYDYFTASDWYDSNGKKVRSWKQKVITWESNGVRNNNRSYGSTIQVINGKEYEYRNGKYYIPNGCGVAVDPYAKDDFDGIF